MKRQKSSVTTGSGLPESRLEVGLQDPEQTKLAFWRRGVAGFDFGSRDPRAPHLIQAPSKVTLEFEVRSVLGGAIRVVDASTLGGDIGVLGALPTQKELGRSFALKESVGVGVEPSRSREESLRAEVRFADLRFAWANGLNATALDHDIEGALHKGGVLEGRPTPVFLSKTLTGVETGQPRDLHHSIGTLTLWVRAQVCALS